VGLQRFASHLNLSASVVFAFACSFVALCTRFSLHKPSKKQQKLSVLGCLQKLCRKQLPGFFQFCLQKLSKHLAEAVHKFVGVCQLQQFWIFMSCDVSSCDVHFTVLGFDVNCFHL